MDKQFDVTFQMKQLHVLLNGTIFFQYFTKWNFEFFVWFSVILAKDRSEIGKVLSAPM